jgi:CBS domain-containing protein
MKVQQIMTHHISSCRPDDTLDVPGRLMWEQDCGCVPVVQDTDAGRRLVAMLTDRDIAMAATTTGRPLQQISVKHAMSRDLCSCHPNDPVSLALKILEQRQLHRLPVVNGDGDLVGMLSLADIAREARREHNGPPGEITDHEIAAAIECICQPRHPQRDMTASA